MEIIIKDKGNQQKVNWFSSIPEKYRQEILDRLKIDKLKIDDPSCSQYQIVLDLMGKDEATMLKERQERLEKKKYQEFMNFQNERQNMQDKQASAYLVSHITDGGYGEGSLQQQQYDYAQSKTLGGSDEQPHKKLLFTLPEYTKPKFLSKTSLLQQLLLKEAEQLGFQPEDNTYIFNEIMKNDFIRQEFEKIHELYGEEAFELNKLSLLNFIKKGRQNFTYSVKYYGVDEGQIGILSRKVPFDQFMKGLVGGTSKIERMVKLPKIVHEIKPKEEEMYEYYEVEQSEEEEVSVEVDASSSDDDYIVPMVSKPSSNQFDILQGTVGGREFQNLKKDSQPIEDQKQQIEDSSPTLSLKPKKKKKIMQKRRVKKKKIIKKLKEQNQDSRLDIDSGINHSMNNIVTLSEASHTMIMDQNNLDSKMPQEQVKSHRNHPIANTSSGISQQSTFQQQRSLSHAQSQPQLMMNDGSKQQRGRERNNSNGNQMQNDYQENEDLQQLENVVDEKSPYMINFRELFKKVELNNLRNFKLPQPEKYNQHIVHSYSIPKGLHSMKRQQFLSEAERYDLERYSKRNIQLQMIDKGYQKMNLGGQTYGLKGSKVKPIYFHINNEKSQVASQHQQSQMQSNQQQSAIMQQSIIQSQNTMHSQISSHQNQQDSLMMLAEKPVAMPLKSMKSSISMKNFTSMNSSINNNHHLLGNKILVDDSQMLNNIEEAPKSSVRTTNRGGPSALGGVNSDQMSNQFTPYLNAKEQQVTGVMQPNIQINLHSDETQNDIKAVSEDQSMTAHAAVNQSDLSMQNKAYQMYNFGAGNALSGSQVNNQSKNEVAMSGIGTRGMINGAQRNISGNNCDLMIQNSLTNKSLQQNSQSHQLNNNTLQNQSSSHATQNSKQQNFQSKKNNQIIKNLARNKKFAENNNQDEQMESQQQQIQQNMNNQQNQSVVTGTGPQQRQNFLKNLQRNQSEGALQYGFQISNQMKISYLMDTRKLLNNKIGNNAKKYQNERDSDSEEDRMIFNNTNTVSVAINREISNNQFDRKPINLKTSTLSSTTKQPFQLPMIKNIYIQSSSAQSNRKPASQQSQQQNPNEQPPSAYSHTKHYQRTQAHPDIAGSEPEKEVFLQMLKQKQSIDQQKQAVIHGSAKSQAFKGAGNPVL
eukprot:403373151